MRSKYAEYIQLGCGQLTLTAGFVAQAAAQILATETLSPNSILAVGGVVTAAVCGHVANRLMQDFDESSRDRTVIESVKANSHISHAILHATSEIIKDVPFDSEFEREYRDAIAECFAPSAIEWWYKLCSENAPNRTAIDAIAVTVESLGGGSSAQFLTEALWIDLLVQAELEARTINPNLFGVCRQALATCLVTRFPSVFTAHLKWQCENDPPTQTALQLHCTRILADSLKAVLCKLDNLESQISDLASAIDNGVSETNRHTTRALAFSGFQQVDWRDKLMSRGNRFYIPSVHI